MPGFPGMMNIVGFGTEIIYAFVIIICCLMIYFGTKELYKLSSHKGIRYFRLSFLFFALAFFFRSFVKITFLLIKNPRTMIFPLEIFQGITTVLFIYFSTMAIFYLIHSMLWKKLNKFPKAIYLFHALAIITAIITIIFYNNILVYALINTILLLSIIIIITFVNKNEKKNLLKVVYILLSVFLFFNIIDILIPEFFQTFQLFIYLVSVIIFLWILYKVLTKVGSN